jgi:predicted TIM-barrel fold metal-dependent hydrolase
MTQPCPGPIPATTPRLKAPPGACDTHAHILGPYDRFPLNEDRGYTAPESPLADFLVVMDTLGLERAVIVHPSTYGTMLGVTEDAIVGMEGRARGVAVVEPDVTDRELERLNEIGFRGARFTTMLRGGSAVANIAPLAERIRPLGWHVQLFIDGPNQLEGLIPMIGDLPVDVVVDHMGHFAPSDGIDHAGFQALLDLVRGGRCWVKLSGACRMTKVGPPYDDMTPFAQALIEARPDRMVWATDWPHVALWDLPMPDDAITLDWALSWGVDEATMRAILVDNPAELYGFH